MSKPKVYRNFMISFSRSFFTIKINLYVLILYLSLIVGCENAEVKLDPVELITNGDFESPDDCQKISCLENWSTDESPESDGCGRYSYLTGLHGEIEWNIYISDGSKGIYQTVGTVPSKKTNYLISFEGFIYKQYFAYWSEVPVIVVIFSAYEEDGDPKSRIAIDTAKIQWYGNYEVGDQWLKKTYNFSISQDAAKPHSGKKLSIELGILPCKNCIPLVAHPNPRFRFDNLSIKMSE